MECKYLGYLPNVIISHSITRAVKKCELAQQRQKVNFIMFQALYFTRVFMMFQHMGIHMCQWEIYIFLGYILIKM